MEHYQILDRLLEGCQVIGPDWRYLYVNDALVEHGRRPRSELVGRTMMEVYPGIEQTAVFAELQRCMSEGGTCNLENEFEFEDGRSGWFELRIQPVPEGLFVLSIDITERKHAEAERERQLRRLRALRAIDLAILGTTSLSVALRSILKETAEQLTVDVAAAFTFDADAGSLETIEVIGSRSRSVSKARVRLGVGAIGQAAHERRTIIVENATDPTGAAKVPAEWRQDGVCVLCAVPMVAKGTLLGVFAVGHRSRLALEPDWVEFLEALGGQTAMAIDAGRLLEDLQRLNLDLRVAYDSTIEGWSRALDLRDGQTHDHSIRVADMTVRLAVLAGIGPRELPNVRRGALLHDIGKIGVPDSILQKAGPLTDDEWTIMRRHPEHAHELLAPIPYLRPALEIPYCHHERWDGTGYPRGLKGEAIPLVARVFAVVDVWDALSSDRPYRKGWPAARVQEHLQGLAGSHLDPTMVDLFLSMIRSEV